jgi:hypothetical protein
MNVASLVPSFILIILLTTPGAVEHALARGAACPEYRLNLLSGSLLRMCNADRVIVHNEILKLQVSVCLSRLTIHLSLL